MDGRSDEHTPALFIFLVFLPFKTQTICPLLPENQTGLQGGEERKKKLFIRKRRWNEGASLTLIQIGYLTGR